MEPPHFREMSQEKNPGADWTVWYQEDGEPVSGMAVFGKETMREALEEAKWSFSPRNPDRAHEKINFLAIVRDGLPDGVVLHADEHATAGYVITYQAVATGKRRVLTVPLDTNLEAALNSAKFPEVAQGEDPAAFVDILAIVQLGLSPDLYRRLLQ